MPKIVNVSEKLRK